MYEDRISKITKQYQEVAERFNSLSKEHAWLSQLYNNLYNDFRELKKAFKTAMKYYE
jgi:predicted nuclease with TOPRIM domain